MSSKATTPTTAAATATTAAEAKKPQPVEEVAEPIKILRDLKVSISLLERTSTTKDLRFLSRVLRQTSALRKRLDPETLLNALRGFLMPGSESLVFLSDFVQKNQPPPKMDVVPSAPTPAPPHPIPLVSSTTTTTTTAAATSSTTTSTTPSTPPEDPKETARKMLVPPSRPPVPEIELYLHLLVVIYLIDNHFAESACVCAQRLIDIVNELHTHRRTLYPLVAKAYFYYSRAFELTHRLSEIRRVLLAAYQTACLRHDAVSQAQLLNLLLRNYLEYNLYEVADKLVHRASEITSWSNQAARYLYYQGKIKSMQLDYTDAHTCLVQAIRKAPQNKARGFRLAAHKLSIIVQLLMGETPDRQLFSSPDLKRHLQPYYALTQAVRVGDLNVFTQVHQQFSDVFTRDKLESLVVRLRHNVIKMGLRKISASYSRISIRDVAAKLYLEPDGAEFIVAKAIRDGVIDAVIDHDNGYVQSRERINIYNTDEPQRAFAKRVAICNRLHNDAVKALMYPLESSNNHFETSEERRSRLQEEEDLASKLADEDMDEF